MTTTRYGLAVLLGLLFTSPLLAAINAETIEYKDGDTTLKGFLAYDDTATGKRPGVVVVPEWWGVNDYVKGRAKQLAELGYVALVADIYGEGFVTTDANVAGQKAGEAKQKGWLRSRGKLAVQTLRQHERVDGEKLAAIGYCFGGTTVLELARAGEDLDGVVSFHGGLDTQQPAQEGNVKARVLVLHGTADPMVPPQQVQALEQEMKQAGAECTVIQYPGAKHSFTNPEADKLGMDAVGYNREADQKSWQAMRRFLNAVIGGSDAGR